MGFLQKIFYWEQRKLGDVARIIAGGDIKKGEIKTSGKYPVLANTLSNDGVVGYYDNNFRVKSPAITVTGRGEVGHAQARKVNFTPVVRLLAVKSKHDVDFLANSINNQKIIVESTGVPQLTSPQLKNYKIFFTTIEEEKKIGSFFIQLNQVISLQERKYEELKLLKKALLQNMFPYNENYNPKYRFLRFTKPWKKKQLGDLMDIGSVKRIHQSDWRSNGVRFLRARDIVANFKNLKPANCLYIDKKTYDQYTIQSGKVSKGDLLVTGVGTIGIPMLINTDVPLYFKDGNIIWFKNSNIIDHNFFYYSFISNTIQDFIKKSSGSGTVGTYTISNGRETPILLPSKEEQQKIGNLLKKCDDLIIFQKRKIKKSKSIKEFLLQNIFI